MAPRRGKKKERRGASIKAALSWNSLTWDDLDRWAGSRTVSRGRTYQRGGRVSELVIAPDGKLLATVTGSRRYANSVWLEPDGAPPDALGSLCTCPVGWRCKHAVAVIAEYLQMLSNDQTAPLADDDDPRWEKLTGDEEDSDGGWSDDEDQYDDDPEDDEEEVRFHRRWRRKAASTYSTSNAEWDKKIEAHVRAKSHQELADFVCSLIASFPQLRTEFQERVALQEGDVDRFIFQARKEIRKVTGESGWRNSWTGEGHTPDYSGIKTRLTRLVESGHSDCVVELGRDLIRRGLEQMGQSDDEGETATALGECLPIVFGATVKSSLTPCEKILFAIDACLEDDYGIIGDEVDVVLKAVWQPADWSAVADALAKRLSAPSGGKKQQWSSNYQRDLVSNWLLDALSRCGRENELVAIYEAEARRTNSYERLVRYLIEQDRIDDAQRWACEGIERTTAELPGIADSLAKMLVAIAAQKKDWKTVAAYAAWEFYDEPCVHTFKGLLTAARKAGCRDAVEKWAEQFLESGVVPWRYGRASKGGDRSLSVDSQWTLPIPDFLVPILRIDAADDGPNRPHFDVLLELAIADKRTDDVLRWHEKLQAAERGKRRVLRWGFDSSYDDQAAAAVAKSHPERALEIYRRRLEDNLLHANPSAYESAANYLRQMRPILKSLNRESEWTSLLTDIRQKHKNRPKLMEILDRLEERPIVEANHARRRK
ncbi:MAG TPA: SWIM zinc finger family protein [Pirellulaceae bacterium]|nr:SWIM zinc finger family protein [Pirellulaceae bacterium]